MERFEEKIENFKTFSEEFYPENPSNRDPGGYENCAFNFETGSTLKCRNAFVFTLLIKIIIFITIILVCSSMKFMDRNLYQEVSRTFRFIY